MACHLSTIERYGCPTSDSALDDFYERRLFGMDSVIKKFWGVVKENGPCLLCRTLVLLYKVAKVLVKFVIRLHIFIYVTIPLTIIGIRFSPELQVLRR